MRQRGIETRTVLEGAGEAAALLAVSNRADVGTTGENLAQYGNLFNLKGDEYVKAADTLSRIKTSKGLSSDELIEASKYFGGRMGAALNLQGAAGAEDSVRFLAFLRQKTAMEGSQLGTATSSFFKQYVAAKEKKKDPTAELERLTGEKLSIFDEKGQFKGLENAIKEFAKLKGKLTDEQMIQFGSQIAGEEGSSVFSAMVSSGAEFDAFNQDINETIGLQKKAATEAENFNNKLEALKGTIENLGSAAFTPMLKPLGSLVDKLNDGTGALTDFAKEHPQIASTTAAVLGLGGAFLTLKGGSGIAGRILGSFTSSARIAGETAAQTATKVGGLRGKLTSASGIFKIALLAETIGFTWEQLDKWRELAKQQQNTNSGLDKVGQMGGRIFEQEKQRLAAEGKTVDYKKEAQSVLQILQQGSNMLGKAVAPERLGWVDWARTFGGTWGNPFYANQPSQSKFTPGSDLDNRRQAYQLEGKRALLGGKYSSWTERVQREQSAATTLQNRAPQLADPQLMTAFRREAASMLSLTDNMKSQLDGFLKAAFPDSFAQSTAQLAQENQNLAMQSQSVQQAMALLAPSTDAFNQSLLNTNGSATAMAFGLNNAAAAANSAAVRFNSIQINPISVPIPSAMPSGAPRARGGSVTKGKSHLVGENGRELFVPNQSGSIISNQDLRSAGRGTAASLTSNFNVEINVAGSRNAEETAQIIRKEIAQLEKRLTAANSPEQTKRRVDYATSRAVERV